MTPNEFRRLALCLPEAVEQEHMGHPDFRVGGKIFATLHGRDEVNGMVKLTPQQQAAFVREEPAVYERVSGGWGRGGATLVKLRAAKASSVRHALAAAWRNTAPKRLAGKLDEE
jgi:hypothetical protein